jgi:hypothetical protein
VTCKRLLCEVPANQFTLPLVDGKVEVGIHNLRGLAGWLHLRQQTGVQRSGRMAVSKLIMDLRTSDNKPRSASLGEGPWANPPCATIHGVLRVQGLGKPSSTLRHDREFAQLGRAICNEICAYTSLESIYMDMQTTEGAADEPFEMRLDASFENLSSLCIGNAGGPDVILTLGRLPRLGTLRVAHLGVGGCVAAKERLQRLGTIIVEGACPRFVELAKFRQVENLILVVQQEKYGSSYGCGLAGFAHLASLPRLRRVRVLPAAREQVMLNHNKLTTQFAQELKVFEQAGMDVTFHLPS